MNLKQIIILTTTLLLLIAISIPLVDTSWEQNNSGIGQQPFSKLDVNAVNTLKISKAGQSVTLKKVSGSWSVQEKSSYPADFAKIAQTIMDIKDLKILKTMKVKDKHFSRLGLDKSTAVKVTCFDKSDGIIAEFLLGKTVATEGNPNMPWMRPPSNRYLKAKKSTFPALVDKEISVTTNSVEWVNDDFLDINKVTSVTYKKGDKDIYQIERKDTKSDFKLSTIPVGKVIDKSKVENLANSFTRLSFDDVTKDITVTSSQTLKVKTEDGFSYTMNFFEVDKKQYLQVLTAGNFVQERVAGKDEKPEDKTKLDQEFADNLKKQQEKLTSVKKLTNWFYQIPSTKTDAWFKSLNDFVKTPAPKPDVPAVPKANEVKLPTKK